MTESTAQPLGPLNTHNTDDLPTVFLIVGMAGSGKTTFINMLNSKLIQAGSTPYIINLDPAVVNLPYTPNIDIRDNISYVRVRKEYNLGPNGAIVCSLNLYATRFDQIIRLIESKRGKHKYVLIDTPGQIEVFTWSASGTIITELLASTFPTSVLYITDSNVSRDPVTFMSNMLYTCSMLYKFNLPFLLCLNKCDLEGSEVVLQWIRDSDAYCAALDEDLSYSSNLSRSLNTVLDRFYELIQTVCVSATLGTGFDQLLGSFGSLRDLYFTDYVKYYENVKKSKVKGTSLGDPIEVGSVANEESDDTDVSQLEENCRDEHFINNMSKK